MVKPALGMQTVRARKNSLHPKNRYKNPAELALMDIPAIGARGFTGIENKRLTRNQELSLREVLERDRKRIGFLVGCWSLIIRIWNRSLRTLSGERGISGIRLAAQIGTQLVGVLYILDEPSIVTSARDKRRARPATGKILRDLGNSGDYCWARSTMTMLEDTMLLMLARCRTSWRTDLLRAGDPESF